MISTDTKILLYVILIFYVAPSVFATYSLITCKYIKEVKIMTIIWNVIVLPFALFGSVFAAATSESFFVLIGNLLLLGGLPLIFLILTQKSRFKNQR